MILAGPSCFTAPSEANPGFLPPELWPRRLDSAGPAPIALPNPALPGPALPDPAQLVPQLPLPEVPGLQLPQIQLPGAAQPAANLRGPAAVTALLGRTPTTAQYMLLNAAVKGGTVSITPQGGAGS